MFQKPTRRAAHPAFSRRAIALIVLSLGVETSFPAFAQNQAGAVAQEAQDQTDVIVLEDINVTAEHRTENLQKTPVAITVIGGSALNNQKIQNVREISTYVPNLVAPTANLPSSQAFYLRGIGESDPFQESTIALYADDVLLPRSLNANIVFDDVERVEVLRGPQGTLYGRNSSAGAIRIISYDPGETPEGSISVGLGNYNAQEVRGRVSGGLGNGFSSSVSFVRNQRDGTVRNEYLGKDTGNFDLTAVRGKLRWRPNSDLDILLTTWGSVDKSDTTPLIPHTPPDGQKFDPYKTWGALDGESEVKTAATSLRIAYQINPQTQFKSITAYGSLEQYGFYDNGGLPWLVNSANPSETDQKYSTQEFQLNGTASRLTYTTGLFFYREDFSADRDISTGGTSPKYHAQRTDTETKSIAAYGQVNYKLTDRLSGTLGLRWTREKKDFGFQAYTLTPYVPGQAQSITGILVSGNPPRVANIHISKNWTSTTPKIGLEYQWTPDLSQYASVSKGFKAGGFDFRASSAVAAETPFEPETVVSYETGVKGEFLNKRLRANVAVFYNDYKDYQASSRDPVLGVVIKKNAKQAHVKGIEIETAWVATSRLNFRLGLGYMDARFDDFDNAVGIDNEGRSFVGSVKGKRIPAAPRLTASAGVNYRVPVSLPGTWRVGADASYRGDYFGDYLNTKKSHIPSRTLLNLTTSYLTPDGKWQFIAAVKNVADKEVQNSSTYTPSVGRYNHIYGDPRTFLVSAQYNFF
jgi:iron complex outermembrane receptor protein